jgi:hypothetical protein
MSSSKRNPLSVTLTIKVTNNETGKDTEQTIVGNAAFLVMDTDKHLMATMIGGTTPTHTVAMLDAVQELHSKVCTASPEIAAAMLLDIMMRNEPGSPRSRGPRKSRDGSGLDALLHGILHTHVPSAPETPEGKDLENFADNLEKLFKDK